MSFCPFCVFIVVTSSCFKSLILIGQRMILCACSISIRVAVFQRTSLCFVICLCLLYISASFSKDTTVFAIFVCLCYVSIIVIFSKLITCFCCSWFYQKMAPSPRSPPPGSIFPDNWCRNFRPPQPSPESPWQHLETTSCLRYGVSFYAVKSVPG